MSLRVIFFICVFGIACGSRSGRSFVPTINGYHEKQRQDFVLPDELLEISGLAFIKDNQFAAINDEKGIIYHLTLGTNFMTSLKFKGKGDYEELVKTDQYYYVLESDGDIIQIDPQTGNDTTYKFKLKKKVEFESLVWYPREQKLVLITKDQRTKKRASVTAFSFDLKTKTFDTVPYFEITLKEILTRLQNFNAECKPSGAALNPVNNHLYIVSSIGKLLLECQKDGTIIRIYKLNPTHFPQPEGITFAKNGDMYISNEGLNGKATILKFPYVAGN